MKLTSRKAILGNSKRQSRQALVYVSGSRKEVEIRKWFIFLMRGFCRFLCLMCIVKLTHVEYATVWHQSNFRPIILHYFFQLHAYSLLTILNWRNFFLHNANCSCSLFSLLNTIKFRLSWLQDSTSNHFFSLFSQNNFQL